ncbi:MAG: N-formylglutamate amidohydrolase [Candidatus Andeanibacterium colombiense]|uniref:N-formylglutamate amidohydrolase n=1 Tax=Candidatus Andeanibacterium colombiense TaxID=3121345 RepID=A0AAJ5X7S9_9SPHN|nr:MAG: N-formylglutamate amidohydrolase [Sphingomonadaceae bacterium]
MRDSHSVSGGTIPGAAGQPAFTLERRDPSPIPIMIAVPHAGRIYPPHLVEGMRSPGEAALKLEDRYVDLLARAVAQETGAALLIAHAPRAMIDLNRSVEEMDWDMLRKGPSPGRRVGRVGRRARSGLGLVPRRLPGIGELWKARIEEADLDSRIEGIHRPYHQAIEDCLGQLRTRWGAALLIDLHSMPPLAPRAPGDRAPEFVIGDRFGAACDGALCAAAFDELALQRRHVAHNRPYAGGYVLDRHAAPARGLHAVQIEICRSIYLDSRLAEPAEDRVGVIASVTALVRRLAGEVAALGRSNQLPMAAE